MAGWERRIGKVEHLALKGEQFSPNVERIAGNVETPGFIRTLGLKCRTFDQESRTLWA